MHNINAAMKRQELTEEEAYFVLRFAGQIGYHKAIRRLKGRWLHHIRRWVVWFGGWESAELLQWDEGWPRWHFRTIMGHHRIGPWPMALFGHRIVLFGHWMQWRWGGGYMTLDLRLRYCYWSPNGTPQHDQEEEHQP